MAAALRCHARAEQALRSRSVPAAGCLPPFPEGMAGPGLADRHRAQETLVLMGTKARPPRPRWKRDLDILA